jgi:hypothetical protein
MLRMAGHRVDGGGLDAVRLKLYLVILWVASRVERQPHQPSPPPAVQPLVVGTFDASFFRVRADRATVLELQYLRAMAELGPGPQRAGDVAHVLGRSSDQLGPTRARLIDKGLLYTPSYGLAAYTVPHFDRYMTRNHPLVRPPKQQAGN